MSEIHAFISNATERFYNVPTQSQNETTTGALVDFIHNPRSYLLQACLYNEKQIQYFTEIQASVKKSIIFYKTAALELTAPDALNKVNMITVTTGAAESLYQVLRLVYSPMLAIGNDLFSGKLQKNLLELESNLRVLTHGEEGENIKVILCVEDEVEYWKALGDKSDAKKVEKEAASAFCVLFEDICEEIRALQSTSMQEVRESAENIAGILDDVWRYTPLPYSQERMVHIFDIVGHVICSVSRRAVSEAGVWAARGQRAVAVPADAAGAVRAWTSACTALTDTYWPNYALHEWKGKPYVPVFCNRFQKRLEEIHEIRDTYDQLDKLLTKSERAELNSDRLLEPFRNINVWICNGPDRTWENAVSKFSADIRPAEAKIAEKLKPRLQNMSAKQSLYEFQRYRTLVNRPGVRHVLARELQLLVSSLLELLRATEKALRVNQEEQGGGRGKQDTFRPSEMTSLVASVQWARHMEDKVKEIETCIENYLKDFDQSAEVLQLASKLQKDLKAMYTQLYEDWSRNIQVQLKDGSLQLSDRPVVEFSTTDRLMVVNFPPGLVRAEGEARALCAAGLAPPAAAALQRLTAPLVYARALHQVASFHNTLAERAVCSTRPLLLRSALALSALVGEQRAPCWDDEAQLERYTRRLKDEVLALEKQNNYLTDRHLKIRTTVEKLMDTELLAKLPEWKKGINNIRDIIEKVEADGFSNTELWRSHWDLQLYKAMECQYIRALLSLHTHFPNVRVDLVLRGGSVRVQPAEEELRARLYALLRRLVTLPTTLQGLGPTGGDFAEIVDKHGWLGNGAVSQLESVLGGVGRACKRWTRRAALCCVPVRDLCATLSAPDHWDLNFRACKAYGQEVAKMTFDDEKIEWITVSTVSLRREFEAQARNLWAGLMTSLTASCRDDAAELEAFMTNASVILEDKTIPKNTKELAEISAKRQQLQEKMPEMEKKVEDLKRKSHLLRTWGGDSSLDSTTRDWDKLRELVTAHQMMFEHQADLVKSSLTGECENLRAAMEAWTARALGRLDVHDMSYDELVTAYEDAYRALDGWKTLAEECDDLMSECEKFNMKPEISETREEAHKLYTELSNLWSPFKEYNEEYQILARQEWIVFQKKLHLFDDFVVKWNKLLEPYTTVTLYIKRELDQYTELTAVLKYLRGPELTEQHWLRIDEAVGLQREAPGPPVLGALLRVAGNLRKNMKLLQKISATASSEAAIRSALNELEMWYAGARLSLRYHTGGDTRQTPVATDYKELLAKVEEQQWVVSSLDGGEAITVWEARLRTARTLLAAAQQAQRRWLYLEPILNNDNEDLGIKFRKVDHLFKQVARIIEADPRLSALVQSTRLQPMLDAISEQLNACQSALNQYIDDKRSIFPRLYFLSDDDLLELLGQAKAGADGLEVVMQSHLKKLFPGLTGVTLGPGGLSVTGLCSQYGEQFSLEQPVPIDCSVEVWLNNLEQEIRSSLKNLTLKCVAANNLPEQDPFSLPTQILCLLQNIRFTEQTEKAIRSKELRKLIENIEKENVYYAAADIEDESEKYKRQALILQCAYYISVVQSLIENNIVATSDWLWQKQLRFYVINKREIVAKMGLAEISYSYEYLGVGTGQFVRTETTDESFLILTQALHLGFVGNPFGPAGTGKTESVKALGSLFGRLVLVFNCDEAMDAPCLARLLSGVARCGAWGCFDEFNRLERPALAAAAHQLTALLAALVAGEKDVVLHGRRVPLSPWCGVAVTLNPAGRGYGGRRVLPAALQAALRPLALRPPPSALLATRLLAALAPCDTPDVYRRLGEDLEAVFELAGTLLSGERHYDWGLRALKAAVGSCGTALSASEGASLEVRRAVLRRVLRLNNLSKLTRYDAQRFENILSMVFADVPEEQTEVDPIYSALENSVKHLGLVRNDEQIQKCVELYEQLQQRMGVVIVGPPGSGKTTIRHLLKTALLQQGRTIVQYVVHPKAMRRECLLGASGERGGGGGRGVLGGVALQAAAHTDGVWSWVVCDGDVDPDWVEALNSVLDDNRVLTLPAGERVQLGPVVGFVFETHSVQHASPATMSRLGVILMSEDSDCSAEILERWARNADFENESVRLSIPILQEAVKKCLRWMRCHGSDIILKHCHVSLTKQIIKQFEGIVQEQSSEAIGISGEEAVYSAIRRSVAGLLKESAFDNFYREMEMSPALPPAATARGARLRAAECVLRAALPHENSLVLGPRACAKNILAEGVLRETFSTVVIIDCTPILEPSDIIAELKRRNVVCGADGGRGGRRGSVVRGAASAGLLVRSLHRAARDTWGSCRVHDFLLELIQEGGFWSAEEGGLQWHSTGRITLVATSANIAQLSPRLSAALLPIVLSEPDEDELMELSEGYLKNSVTKNIPDKDIAGFVRNMLLLYKEVCHTFDSHPHYTWNCSHLRQWCENIKYYSPTTATEVLTAVKAEAAMIFRERLITDKEKIQYNTIAQKHLKVDDSEVFYKPKLKSDGVYLERVDPQEWYHYTQKLINQCLTDGAEGAVGVEACEEQRAWGAAAAGALNGGVATCVSAAGSGRRAAAALACSALGAALHTAQHRRHFYAVCKNAITSASEGTRTLLVLGEAVSAGAWLGCVEALLKADSLHALPADMVPSLGHTQTQTFTNIKQNLGIMICLDKDQENINALMEQYPLLHSTSRMYWLDHWSLDTLRKMPSLVVERLIKDNVDEMSQEDLNTLPIDGFVGIYQSLDAEWLRAPSRYLHFIRAYHHILGTKRGTLLQRRNMLAAGVEALERARNAVSVLQGAATKQEEALGVERAAAATALQHLGGTVRAATERKEEMQLLKKNIEEENEKLQIRKKEIEAGLAAVEPVVAAARAAVGDIRTESLSEVRSLRAPPEVVRDVLEGVLRLMGIADTSWHSMKNFLSKRGVKEDIRCLDARSISPAAVTAVERLVERRASSFSAENARRASAAVAPLAAWVHANLEHAKALARVRPLQERQRELHEDLRRAEAELGSLSSGLVAADERVSELQTRLGRHERDAAALEHELARAGDTLRAARDLLERLSGEAASWESDLENISREILELNQRSLLAAGYMIYLPHLTEPQSRDYLKKWSALIGFEDETFSVINFLSSAEEQLQWQAEGLPSDRSAAKNAAVFNQCMRLAGGSSATPVLLDPEGAALRWVRSALPAHRLVSARADGLLPALHYATRLGGILVITDVEDIEDWWWSASSGCRMIILSRDTALIDRLLPHVRAEITPLYFTARLDTLLDQLVNYVMENQHPEIYEKCKEIILTKANLQKKQHELQENLLRDLSRDTDILHDAGLLASLKSTRASGAAVSAALAEADVAEEEARARGAGYRACAMAPARLALAARRLAARHPLVALPARAVRDAFLAAVRRASTDPKNINNDEVAKYSVKKIIERVLLSVHKKDKYTVALHLLKEAHEDLVPDKLWRLLLGNFNLEIEDKNLIAGLQKQFNWMSEDCVRRLAQIKIQDENLFGRLSLERSELWREFQRSGSANALSALAPHERTIVAAATHPPALYAVVGAWLRHELGGACVQGGDALSAAAGGRAALLLAPQVSALSAAAARAACELLVVGVDEGINAWEAHLESARGGAWLAIAVGASPFPQDLVLFVEAVTERPESDFSDKFCLWIVAEEREIPSALTNACVTVILEPPEGVKRNACSTLSSWTPRDRDADATRLLAGAALLHAVVQERRAYIPIGWSRWYGWEWGDVRAAHAAVCAAEGAGARELCCALYAARVSVRADRAVLSGLAPRFLSGALPARVQPRANLQDYITAFESLPDADEPALLALPANCRGARDLRAARRLLAGLAELSTTAPIEKGDTVTPLKTLRSLFKKSMAGSPLLRSDYRVENVAGWWGAVCAGEARDAARAFTGLRAGLRTGMGAPREAPLARVPDDWQLLWSGPEAPDEYIEEFCHRARAAVDRMGEREFDEDYMPKEVDLRSFLRPARVLSALLARRAARSGRSPAALALQARWDLTAAEDEDTICVRGLCLSGGEWRGAGGGGKGAGGALETSGVDSPPLTKAPPLLLRYVARDEGANLLDPHQAPLPLYESVRREVELCVVRAPLAASLSPREAALHAVALLVAPLR